jgi:hypothetical protein
MQVAGGPAGRRRASTVQPVHSKRDR